MAITFEGSADFFTPAYNQINYYVDSTNKNEEGFRYVVDLYRIGSPIKIWESRVAPRSADGLGVIKLQGILSNYVTHETNLDSETFDASNSWMGYELKIGEEFIKEWAYSDYEVYGNISSPYNAYTQLRQFTETAPLEHNYSVGDQIEVVQADGGALKPILSGLHIVVEVVDAWTVVIELPFSAVGLGATVGGSVIYADKRKTITRNLATKQAVIYNSALGNNEFLTVPFMNRIIAGSSTTKTLLTNLPLRGFRATPTQKLKVNLVNYVNVFGNPEKIYFQNDAGDLFSKATGASSSTAIRMLEVGATVTGLTLVSGTTPLIKSDTQYYEFWIASTASGQMTAKYKIDVDTRCSINDTELIFLDRKGSLCSFAFQARNAKTVAVNRTNYVKSLGDLGTVGGVDKWTYSNQDAGSVTNSVSINEEFKLRTYWMTDAMSVYFEELVTSPYVLMKWEGVYYRVDVLDTSIEVEREKDKGLIKKEINVRFSNQTNINA